MKPRLRLCFFCFLLLALTQPAVAAGWLSLPGARIQTIDEPVFGGKVWVYEVGREHAQSVVLLHGIGDEASGIWQALIPELARHYHVLAFDLPGFGRSGKGNKLYSPTNYTALLRYLSERFIGGPFKLVGHSTGGAIALKYAAEFPADLSQLVLIDVSGILHRAVYGKFLSFLGIRRLPSFYPGQNRDLAGLVGRVLRKLELLDPDPGALLYSEEGRERILEGRPNRIAAMALVEENFSEEIAGVRAPTSILWGAKDEIAPLRTGKLLAAGIAGARLRVLPELGHTPMLADPLQFNTLLLQELRRPPAELARLREVGAYAQAARPPASGARTAGCVSERGVTFRGDYESLSIRGCDKVKLIDVRVRHVHIVGSVVEIENSHIFGGDGIGLKAEGTELRITGGSIRGRIALSLNSSRADLAGVRLLGEQWAVEAAGGRTSDLLMSVSYLSSGGTGRYWHDVLMLQGGKDRL